MFPPAQRANLSSHFFSQSLIRQKTAVPQNIIRNRDPHTIRLGIRDKNMLIKFRYNDWEIPRLIHLITITLVLCARVDEFRDDNISCVYWGKEAAAIHRNLVF